MDEPVVLPDTVFVQMLEIQEVIYVRRFDAIDCEINRSTPGMLRLVIATDMPVIFETPRCTVDMQYNFVDLQDTGELIAAILHDIDCLNIHRVQSATTSTSQFVPADVFS
jgi:hypothetical protein